MTEQKLEQYTSLYFPKQDCMSLLQSSFDQVTKYYSMNGQEFYKAQQNQAIHNDIKKHITKMVISYLVLFIDIEMEPVRPLIQVTQKNIIGDDGQYCRYHVFPPTNGLY